MKSALRESDKYSITIALPLFKTDSNRILGVNKFAKNKRMKAVKKAVVHACRNLAPPKPLTKFHIYATRHGARYYDDDNLHTLLKPYVDGLKMAGVIKNDSWKYLKPKDMTRDQVIGVEEMLLITVVEVDDQKTK
jgi:hypothetical protein